MTNRARAIGMGLTLALAAATLASTPAAAQTTEVTPAAFAVTASGHDGNPPGNTVDNDLNTRWSANGDGAWIRYDLGQMRTVSHVRIAVYRGDTRRNFFDLQVSSDGASWATVLVGAHSSGTTIFEETYDFADVPARYVRYVGHGNTLSTWNSLTEVSIFAVTGGAVSLTPGAAAVTASSHDGNPPGNTVDGNLGTRWSANGDGQWLKLDLGAVRTVAFVKIAVYNGTTRRNRFDVQVSSDNVNWTPVWSGESSGTTTALESYDFPDLSARWVRYLGHGNNASTWNSLTEVEVWGTP
jgi:hypothetical protein